MDPLRRFLGQRLSEADADQSYTHDVQGSPSSPLLRPWTPSGSLQSVFSSTEPAANLPTDSISDFDLSSLPPSLSASQSVRSRPRLDESAGEGLRRSVLVRNAMLSSLERERRLAEEAESSETANTPHLFYASMPLENTAIGSQWSKAEAYQPDRRESNHEHFEREVQWFEELLSELHTDEDFEDDFVNVSVQGVPEVDAALASSDNSIQTTVAPSPLDAADSGFAERQSQNEPGSGNVCLHSVPRLVRSSSSDELPALVEDDSDVDDDEDDTPLAEPDQDPLHEALVSRPISPVLNPVEQMRMADLLSPPSTRPTSPSATSSSSKSDSDPQSSPVHAPEELPPLPSFSHLTLYQSRQSRYEDRIESLDLALAHLYSPTAQSVDITVNGATLGNSSSRRSQSADSRGSMSGGLDEAAKRTGRSTMGADPNLVLDAGFCHFTTPRSALENTQATRTGAGIVQHWNTIPTSWL